MSKEEAREEAERQAAEYMANCDEDNGYTYEEMVAYFLGELDQ